VKYLTLSLTNGEEIEIRGETVNDVPDSVVHATGWSAFVKTNGLEVQVRSEHIIAIHEHDTVLGY
jgi:hypothetical protein